MSTTNFLAQAEAQLIVDTFMSTKAPTNHASSSTGYGIGSSSNYGHVKIIDNLNTSNSTNGEALSAHQGYELNSKIENLNHIVHCTCSTTASTQVKVITVPQGVEFDDGDILCINFLNTNTYNATSNNYVTFSINNVEFDIAQTFNPSSSAIVKPLGTSPDYYGTANQIHTYKMDLTHGCLIYLGHSADNSGGGGGGGVDVSMSTTEPSNPSNNMLWLGGE